VSAILYLYEVFTLGKTAVGATQYVHS